MNKEPPASGLPPGPCTNPVLLPDRAHHPASHLPSQLFTNTATRTSRAQAGEAQTPEWVREGAELAESHPYSPQRDPRCNECLLGGQGSLPHFLGYHSCFPPTSPSCDNPTYYPQRQPIPNCSPTQAALVLDRALQFCV